MRKELVMIADQGVILNGGLSFVHFLDLFTIPFCSSGETAPMFFNVDEIRFTITTSDANE